MIIINIFINFIFAIFIIKEDIKTKKILNKYLIKYCIIFFILKLIEFYFYPIKLNYYLLQYYILSFILPFSLYLLKIWGAGDSKLLSLYFLFLPNIIVEKYYYIYFLRYLNFLFIFSCIIYFIVGVIKIIKTKHFFLSIDKKKCTFQIKYLLFIILFLNIINIILNSKININVYFSICINLLIIFIIQRKIYKFFTNKNLNITLIFLILLNIKFINISFLYRIFMAIAIFFIKQIIEFSEKKEVLIEEIKIGDIISIKTLQAFSKSRVKNLPKLDNNSQKKFYMINNLEELEAIKRWRNSKYGESTIEIEKTIPFSIYICITYILSIIFYIYNIVI